MSNPDVDPTNEGASAEDSSQKPAAVEKVVTATTNGTDHDTTPVAMNGHGPFVNGSLKVEDAVTATKTTADLEEEEEEPDTPDEEENLFITLEEQEKAHSAMVEQPKAVEAAPRLLQAALKEGQVKADESEEESDKEKTASPDKKNASPEPHIHKRVRFLFRDCDLRSLLQTVAKIFGARSITQFARSLLLFCSQGNQLDFLLSKASEYSNFIAKDLDELQASMTDQAAKALAKAEKKRRKGDSSGGGGGGKKKKTSKDGVQKLESVQAKDAVIRNGGGGSKPIFIQPANLAADCFLMDYQLEGVRWLASLFENGVSGILADGTWVVD